MLKAINGNYGGLVEALFIYFHNWSYQWTCRRQHFKTPHGHVRSRVKHYLYAFCGCQVEAFCMFGHFCIWNNSYAYRKLSMNCDICVGLNRIKYSELIVSWSYLLNACINTSNLMLYWIKSPQEWVLDVELNTSFLGVLVVVWESLVASFPRDM